MKFNTVEVIVPEPQISMFTLDTPKIYKKVLKESTSANYNGFFFSVKTDVHTLYFYCV